MLVIENRQQLVEKIKNTDVNANSGEDLHTLAKHVAAEAVEKCVKERETRVDTFLAELYTERDRKIEVIATA